MHPCFLRHPLVIALACACATPVVAHADAVHASDAATLDRVVVTAAPVSPLTYETDPTLPRQPVPASDGADYLKTIPGFTALRNGGTNGDPVLRGMFGSRLNLLTNDGSMPGACPARMDNPLSYVAPETYDRLVVVKGPQTVLWGPGASAGTVRFERDTPRFDAPGLRVDGSLLGGSHGRNDQVLDATAGASRGYARLSANRFPGRRLRGWRRSARALGLEEVERRPGPGLDAGRGHAAGVQRGYRRWPSALCGPRHGRLHVPPRQRQPAVREARPAGGAGIHRSQRVPQPGRPPDGQLHAA